MRVDVQTHHMPDAYVKALAERSDYPRFESAGGSGQALGNPQVKLPMEAGLLDLSVKLEEMDIHQIDLALISLNIPGPDLAGEPSEADELARIGNDGIADAVSRHPGRFRGAARGGSRAKLHRSRSSRHGGRARRRDAGRPSSP